MIESSFELTDDQVDDLIDKVERAIGHAHNAWDMVDQRELVRAVLKAADEIKSKA